MSDATVPPMDMRLATTTITPELLAYIVQKIVRAVNAQKIILFGSYARGQATEHSDLDLFVIYDGDKPVRDVRRELDGLLWGRRFGLDLWVRTPQQVQLNMDDGNSFYIHHIFGEGRVLYERKT